MERTVAVKKLAKMLGKGFGYRVDPKAPDAEEREAARLEWRELAAARKQVEADMIARRDAILEADKEYQDLKAAFKKSREAADRAASRTHHYRFTAGTSNGMFFHIKAQGDSWEEVIEKVSK